MLKVTGKSIGACAALLAATVLTLTGPPAFASAEKKPDGAPYVDISTVAVPVIDAGRVRNYVFVGIRLHLAPGTDASAAREKVPYMRDDLVRTAYRTPFTVPSDWTTVDTDALSRRLLADSRTIMGPKTVAKVEITSITPMRRAGMTPVRR